MYLSKKPSLLFLAFLLIFFVEAKIGYAQNTDQTNLWILYDVSGSMTRDTFHNSRKILGDILHQAGPGATNWKIILFGDSLSIKKSVGYSRVSGDTLTIQGFLSQFDQPLIDRRNVLTSDFLEGLKMLADDAQNQPNGAAIIISDGIISESDIPKGMDIKAYQNKMDNILNSLTKGGMSFFMINTTNMEPPKKPYEDRINFPYMIQEGISNDSVYVNDKFFYIHHKHQYNQADREKLTNFVNRVYQDITYTTLKVAQTRDSEKLSPEEEVIFLATNTHFLYEFQVAEGTIEKADFKTPKIFKDSLIRVYKEDLTQSLLENNVCSDLNQVSDDCLKHLARIMQNSQHISPNELEAVKTFLHVAQKNNLIQKARAASGYQINASSITPQSKAGSGLLDVKQEASRFSLSQADLIAGLADFLQERVEMELIVVTYEELRKNLFDHNSFIRDTLFFQTYQIIKEANPNILILREAFEKDLQYLPENLTKSPDFKHHSALIYLEYGSSLLKNLSQNGSIEDALSKLENVYAEKNRTRMVSEEEKGILFLSRFFRYLKVAKLDESFRSWPPEKQKIFISLVASKLSQEYPEINQVTDLNRLTKATIAAFDQYDAVKRNIKYLQELNKEGNSPANENLQNIRLETGKRILRESTSLLVSSVQFAGHFTNQADYEKIKSSIYKTSRNANAGIELYFLIKEENYLEAAMLLIPIADELLLLAEHDELFKVNIFGRIVNAADLRIKINHAFLEKARSEIVNDEHLNKLQAGAYQASTREDLMSLLKQDGLGFIATVKEIIEYDAEKNIYKVVNLNRYNDIRKIISSLHAERKFNKKFRKELSSLNYDFEDYTGLIQYFTVTNLNKELQNLIEMASTVSMAKDATGVKNAIKSTALPPASYRIKREHPFTIMATAYPGVGAQLRLNKVNPIFSAPIGIEFSRSNPQKKNNRVSWSLLIPIMDIGNIFDYDDSSEGEDVKFSQVVSPGIIGFIGIPKLPIAIGLGYMLNPERGVFNISFDLPMYRLR